MLGQRTGVAIEEDPGPSTEGSSHSLAAGMATRYFFKCGRHGKKSESCSQIQWTQAKKF